MEYYTYYLISKITKLIISDSEVTLHYINDYSAALFSSSSSLEM